MRLILAAKSPRKLALVERALVAPKQAVSGQGRLEQRQPEVRPGRLEQLERKQLEQERLSEPVQLLAELEQEQELEQLAVGLLVLLGDHSRPLQCQLEQEPEQQEGLQPEQQEVLQPGLVHLQQPRQLLVGHLGSHSPKKHQRPA
jgi:predicted house-cleaning NTP pyrophosphatase (Maf/HAM1 superfamily)